MAAVLLGVPARGRALGCGHQAWSQVSGLTVLHFLWLPGRWPRWRSWAGFLLPSPKCVHMVWAGSPWDTQASLSLGQTTGVRGMVGLATGGAGSCQSLPLLPLGKGTGGFRQRGCSERGSQRGREGWQGDARAYILASSSAAGPGETMVRLRKLTPFSQG